MAAAMLENHEIGFDVAGPSNESPTNEVGQRKRRREECIEIKQKINMINAKVSKLESSIKKQEESLREIKALLHYICNQKKL